MEAVLSLCGFRCDLCLAFRPNIETHPENRQVLSDGWHTYFGFRIAPEEIFCNGCSTSGGTTLDSKCPVRPCVISRGLQHCAACKDYLCDNLKERLIDFNSFQAAHGKTIPETDRQRFILPYENACRLEALRLMQNPAGDTAVNE